MDIASTAQSSSSGVRRHPSLQLIFWPVPIAVHFDNLSYEPFGIHKAKKIIALDDEVGVCLIEKPDLRRILSFQGAPHDQLLAAKIIDAEPGPLRTTLQLTSDCRKSSLINSNRSAACTAQVWTCICSQA